VVAARRQQGAALTGSPWQQILDPHVQICGPTSDLAGGWSDLTRVLDALRNLRTASSAKSRNAPNAFRCSIRGTVAMPGEGSHLTELSVSNLLACRRGRGCRANTYER
jgi:hypothetical protein